MSKKKINLALQGGGSHGAFTWGVLDRLLEDESIEIEGISGTSAGAMTGTLVAYGMVKGGRDHAKELLEVFWRKVSTAAVLSPLQPSMFDKMIGNADLSFSPHFQAMEYMLRVFSPAQLNVFDINPLRDLLEELIDFRTLREQSAIKLFINATNVRTGKVRVFESKELSCKMVLASACLPMIFKTVEVEGDYYWDGGYSGNPALFPLIYKCDSPDIVVVQINPINIDEAPVTMPDIIDRINEISFNASLMHEMRAISFVSKLLEKGKVDKGEYKAMFIHMIEAEDMMVGLGHSSKFNADWEFLKHLREVGRQAADDWLAENGKHLGNKSSLDIKRIFL